MHRDEAVLIKAIVEDIERQLSSLQSSNVSEDKGFFSTHPLLGKVVYSCRPRVVSFVMSIFVALFIFLVVFPLFSYFVFNIVFPWVEYVTTGGGSMFESSLMGGRGGFGFPSSQERQFTELTVGNKTYHFESPQMGRRGGSWLPSSQASQIDKILRQLHG